MEHMARVDSVNKQIGKELSSIVSKEIMSEKYMITITYVKCSGDLSEAKVGISVLPKGYTGTALRELKRNTKDIIDKLKKRIKIKRLPYIKWEVDKTEREAQELDDTLEEVKEEKIQNNEEE